MYSVVSHDRKQERKYKTQVWICLKLYIEVKCLKITVNKTTTPKSLNITGYGDFKIERVIVLHPLDSFYLYILPLPFSSSFCLLPVSSSFLSFLFSLFSRFFKLS